MSDGLRVDLHVHSHHSPDSRLDLDAIARQLPYVGLRGFALTDHNTVAGHAEIPALRAKYPGTLVLPGVEVSTREGHLLVYGVSEVPPLHRPIDETLAWARERNGVSVLAHPFRIAHGAGRRVAETSPVLGIETRNGHSSAITNYQAEIVAARRSLPGTGGSDVHELSDLGRAYTEFPSGVTTAEEMLESLRGHRIEPGGRSLRFAARFRLGLRTGVLLLARGFRPI